ncbi:MAG: hypothetical protein ACRCX2_27915 [Paraclostridium sp.]
MILDIVFFIFILVLCWSRHKGYCGTCDGNKAGDIFQIITVGTVVIFFVGIVPVIKLLIIILLTCAVRYAFLNRHGQKENTGKGKNGKKGCCDDLFN